MRYFHNPMGHSGRRATSFEPETRAHALTSRFLLLADKVVGADSDRSGLTSSVIAMIRTDRGLADTIMTSSKSHRTTWKAGDVEAVLGIDRILNISRQTGQTPYAVEIALRQVLPMLGAAMSTHAMGYRPY